MRIKEISSRVWGALSHGVLGEWYGIDWMRCRCTGSSCGEEKGIGILGRKGLFAVIDDEFKEWAWSCELTSFCPAAATIESPASLC
nr:hypothetical protein [Tanacetum cinerariifolium]